jgi:hypothetical protein
MKRAELYAVERGCTDAFLDTFSFSGTTILRKARVSRFWDALRIIRWDISGGHPLNSTAKQPYITEEYTGRPFVIVGISGRSEGGEIREL